MKFIEEAGAIRCGISGERVCRELHEGIVSAAVLCRRGVDQAMALGDAAQILVGNGNGVAKRIEQDGVGCFRPYTGQRNQAHAKLLGGRGGEAIERAGEFIVQHGEEGFERGSLACNEAGRADQFLQLFQGESAQAVGGKCAGAAEVGEREFDGFPRSVLREVSAEDHFEGRLGGPPVLWAVGCEEALVHAAQTPGGAEDTLHRDCSSLGDDCS